MSFHRSRKPYGRRDFDWHNARRGILVVGLGETEEKVLVEVEIMLLDMDKGTEGHQACIVTVLLIHIGTIHRIGVLREDVLTPRRPFLQGDARRPGQHRVSSLDRPGKEYLGNLFHGGRVVPGSKRSAFASRRSPRIVSPGILSTSYQSTVVKCASIGILKPQRFIGPPRHELGPYSLRESRHTTCRGTFGGGDNPTIQIQMKHRTLYCIN